ncbi:MAG: PQQ-binding-like beta-propeller repeat protein [Bacteroidota bacterium]
MKHLVIAFILLQMTFPSFCQWHNDFLSQHNYESKALRKNPSKKWVFEAKGKVFGPALREDNSLFFGDIAGYLYSINAENGKLNWKFRTNGKVLSCPSIKDTLAYFGSYDGYLYCLGVKSGHLVWKYKTGSGASCSPPLVKNGKVYFGSHDDYFYVTDRLNGKLIAKKKLGHGNCTTTSFENNLLYLADWGGNVHCLNAESLESKWKFQTDNKVYQTPTLDTDQVLIPSFDSTVYALDKISGKINWKMDLNSVAVQIGIKGDIAFFNTRSSNLYALNKNSGDLLWKFETEGTTWGFAILAEDIIYFGSGDNKLYAIGLKSGNKLWEFVVDQDVQRPSIYKGVVYFPSGKHLYALH